MVKRPLVWVAFSYAAGVFVGGSMVNGPTALSALLFLLAGTPIAIVPRKPRVHAAGLACVFFSAGLLMWALRHDGLAGDPVSRFVGAHPDTPCVFHGRVRSLRGTYSTSRSTEFVLDVTRVEGPGASPGIHGRTVVYWQEPAFPLYVGEHVRVRGVPRLAMGPLNPGLSSREDYLRRRGIQARLDAAGPESLHRARSARWWSLGHWASRLREVQARLFRRIVPHDARNFVEAVWLGDRTRLGDEEREDYVRSGTAHILAVSGVHVGIVYATVACLLGLVMPARRPRALLTGLCVVLFALTAGARISSLRAAAMVIVFLTADLFERERDAPTALSISALLFLIWNPDYLFDSGFVLSFLSVGSILIFGDRFAGRMPQRFPSTVRTGVSTAAAVQILPLPVAVHTFHVLPLVGPVANLIVVPLLGATLWLSFLTVAGGLVAPWVATLFGHALMPVVAIIRWAARMFAALPGGHWSVAGPTAYGAACYWGAAVCLAGGLGGSRRRRRAWRAGALTLGGLAVVLWSYRPVPSSAEVVFLDVGPGEATFVRTADGATALIDGGPNRPTDAGQRVVLPFLRTSGVHELDYVVLTRGDGAHGGGLRHVLENIRVGEVVLGPDRDEGELERGLLDVCARRGVPVRRVAGGDAIRLAGATLEVIHPAALSTRCRRHKGAWPCAPT